MKKLLWDAITFVLEHWFVPREDYDFVQDKRWGAERHVERLIKEQYELLNTIYSRKYKHFAELNENDQVELIRLEHLDTDQIEFHWRFRITRKQYVMTYDPKQAIYSVQRHVLERVTLQFRDNLAKRLQWDT